MSRFTGQLIGLEFARTEPNICCEALCELLSIVEGTGNVVGTGYVVGVKKRLILSGKEARKENIQLF